MNTRLAMQFSRRDQFLESAYESQDRRLDSIDHFVDFAVTRMFTPYSASQIPTIRDAGSMATDVLPKLSLAFPRFGHWPRNLRLKSRTTHRPAPIEQHRARTSPAVRLAARGLIIRVSRGAELRHLLAVRTTRCGNHMLPDNTRLSCMFRIP